VFVHTVAGGLGLFFSQLAKARGATVIGTTSTAEKSEVAKAHGADHVILYKSEDTVQRVKELTDGKGVDVVYDGVGKDTYARSHCNDYRRFTEKQVRAGLRDHKAERDHSLCWQCLRCGTAIPTTEVDSEEPQNPPPIVRSCSSDITLYGSNHPIRLLNYLVTPEEIDFYGPKLFSEIATGSVKLKVFKEYPFTAEGVRQSQLDLTGGKTTGKLLIKILD
jgi:NADPH:quinone reductase